MRFQAILRELRIAPCASSFNEAYTLLCAAINGVEDTLTTIPYDPGHWQTDGRIYPPQMDNMRDVPGHENVNRFRSRGHNTFIAQNGAVEIQEVASDPPQIVFSKLGCDGRGVWE